MERQQSGRTQGKEAEIWTAKQHSLLLYHTSSDFLAHTPVVGNFESMIPTASKPTSWPMSLLMHHKDDNELLALFPGKQRLTTPL